ncbi:MAG: ABC transporter permease [Gemmatimonadota bacterium]
MVKDVRVALRSLTRTPGYALAFVITLGLGIGLNTAIFSVINGVLLAPLPYDDADRIVYVQQPALLAGVDNAAFSFVEVQDYREASRTLDEIVEYGDWTFNVVAETEPHRAVGGLVTSNYFEVLGLRPQLGRTLQSQDDGRDAEPAMVLTHDYWTRVFGADPEVLGRTVRLYAFAQPKTTRIVGVLAPGVHYTGTRRQDFFVNYATNEHYLGAAMQDERTHRMTDVFARLAPGQTVEAARSELESVNASIKETFPAAYPEHRGYGIRVARWQDELTREARPIFLVLMGTVGLVLLLACANVANLTLTRLIRREREMAIRAALGAGRRRLRAQLLTENLLLSLAGAGLGLALAVVGLDLLVEYADRFTVRTGEIGVDGAVLAFTILVAVGIALVLAWAPSLPGVRSLGSAVLAAGTVRSSVSLPRKQLQRGLVVSQLGLSFMLLIGAALLVRSLLNLTRVDAGIDYESVVAMDAPNVTGDSVSENRALMEQVLDQVAHYPGVVSAGYATRAPFEPTNLFSPTYRVEGGDENGAVSPMSTQNTVSLCYFRTVRIPILVGREFNASDTEDTESVVILNETMARDLFGAEDPIDGRIAQKSFNGEWGPWLRVVGVAADTREYGLAQSGTHTVYRPAAQGFAGPTLLVRTHGDVGVLARQVREVVRGLDPDRPVDNVKMLEDLRAEDLAPQRLNATLFSAFALLALLIATVGVLGVLAFTVSQRTQEFGIRMALGAAQNRVLGMVLREGVAMALAGLVLGGVGAAFLSRFIAGMLFEVDPVDPAVYAGVGSILAGAAVLAAYLPARRATRVDPMDALRSE